MDIRGLNAIIKLDVGLYLNLGDGHILQSLSSPGDDFMNFIQIKVLLFARAFGNEKRIIHAGSRLCCYLFSAL